MKTLTTLALGLLLISLALDSVAFAGGYRLLKYLPGAGWPGQEKPMSSRDLELCKAYERVLNSPSQGSYPLACGASMGSKFRDFKKPDWILLDVKKNKHLINKMDYLMHTRGTFVGKDWERGFENRVATGYIRLSLAELDIDREKYIFFSPTNVLKYILEYYSLYDGPCDPSADWFDKVRGNRYFLTNEDLTDVKEIGGLGSLSFCGVFSYNGAVYFEAFEANTWNDRGSRSRSERHYENYIYEYVEVLQKPTVFPICRYKYIGDVKREE